MGKLQSKHDFKRRENPEGGTFAANALTCQVESCRLSNATNAGHQELCCRGLKDTWTPSNDCHLEVVLPPERGGDREHKCNIGSEHTNQEWIFTLYHFDNSGKITKEDMSSLMHSIYEVVEASVKQPSKGSTALKVKLMVTPVSKTNTHSQIDQDVSHTQEAGSPDRNYCVDENTERRNHYLDLAGIENYSSKFDDPEATNHKPRQHIRSAHQRRSVVVEKNCSATESRGRGLSFLRSLRSKAKAPGGDRAGGGSQTAKFHGQHPALWCQPQPQAKPVLQHAQTKRLRTKAVDTAGSPSRTQVIHHPPTDSQVHPGGVGEMLPSRLASCGGLVTQAQRHHHHHHKHHHHHHHYHYHPA